MHCQSVNVDVTLTINYPSDSRACTLNVATDTLSPTSRCRMNDMIECAREMTHDSIARRQDGAGITDLECRSSACYEPVG